jgi:hypothetical protein
VFQIVRAACKGKGIPSSRIFEEILGEKIQATLRRFSGKFVSA